MTEMFCGKLYRKMSGRRYAYLQPRLPEEGGGIIFSIENYARMMALCLANADESWAVVLTSEDGATDCPNIEAKAREIVDDCPIDEVFEVGDALIGFNNLGLQAAETVEKN